MIEKNSFMTYDIGWGLAGHIFFTRVHLSENSDEQPLIATLNALKSLDLY